MGPKQRSLNMLSKLISSILIKVNQSARFSYHAVPSASRRELSHPFTARSFSVSTTERKRKVKRKSAVTKRVVDALQAYKEIYGDLEIKSGFVIPTAVDGVEPELPWPKAVQGIKLGNRIGEIRTEYRSGYISAQRVSDKSLEALIVKLDKMGFIFCRREQQKQVLMLAVTTYKSIYNDLSIPKAFVCPKGDYLWPESTWGMKLGFSVGNIRNKGNFPDLVEELMSLGMNFDPYTDHRGGEDIGIAVKRFYELYGNYKIPVQFKVPDDRTSPMSTFKKRSEMVENPPEDVRFHSNKAVEEFSYKLWPESVRGLKLGFKFHNIYYSRSNISFRAPFLALGYFVDMEAPPSLWSRSAKYGDLLVALKEFKALYGHLNVPDDFVVPMDEEDIYAGIRHPIDSGNGSDVATSGVNDNHGSSSSSSSGSVSITSSGSDNDLIRDNHGNDSNIGDLKLDINDSETIIKNGDDNGSQKIDGIVSLVDQDNTNIDSNPDNPNPINGNSNIYVTRIWSRKSQGIKLGTKVRHLRFRAKFLAKNRDELTALGFDWRHVGVINSENENELDDLCQDLESDNK